MAPGLFVTNAGSGTVTKIDTATNEVTIAPIKVGNAPSSIAISPDGKYAYVTNTAGNTVSVITCPDNAVKTIAGVGSSPTDVVLTGGQGLRVATSTAPSRSSPRPPTPSRAGCSVGAPANSSP